MAHPRLQDEEQQAVYGAAARRMSSSWITYAAIRRRPVSFSVLWQDRTPEDTPLLKELGFPHDVIYLHLSHTLERDAAKAAYDKAQLLRQRKEMMQRYADYFDSLRKETRRKF